MRNFRVNRFKIEVPEDVQALYEIKREGNHSMLMLAKVWRAERARRESSGRSCGGPVFRITVEFHTETRECLVVKWSRIPGTIGVLPYNKALQYCRAKNLKMLGPEDRP